MIPDYDIAAALFKEGGFELDEMQYEKFFLYSDLLVDWNEKINLTAITEPLEIAEKHFLDSIFPLKMVDIFQNASMIDVGTGAGFPGLPLKIIRPDIKLTLLDSLNKRVNFLQEVAEKLDMSIECIHSRAEDGGKNAELREKFDFAVARAVANLPVLCEYCLPYVKVGGKFLALKGPNENYKNAFTAYKALGAEISEAKEYTLPCGDKRQLIIFDKVKPTPQKYPRNAAQMSKKPL